MSETRVPARSVLFLQAKPGMRDELVEVFRRIDIPGNALLQEGCLSVEVQVPPDEDGPLLVTALWTHRAAYDGWLANPWREHSGSELAPYLAGESWRRLRHRPRRRRRLRRRGGRSSSHGF